MLRKQLTVVLCTTVMTGLILSGCSNSESAESTAEETDSEQQEEEVEEAEPAEETEPAEEAGATEEADMDAELFEEPEAVEEEASADVFDSETAGPTAGVEEPANTSQAAAAPAAEPEEMELKGGDTMAVAAEIPLNTKAAWSTGEDEGREWYAFKTEAGSEDMTYQIAVGGIAKDFIVQIYVTGENEPIIDERGNSNGATKVIDLDGPQSGTTYYVYLSGVSEQNFYVLITPVSAD